LQVIRYACGFAITINYNNKEDKHVLSENYYRLKLYVKKNKKQID